MVKEEMVNLLNADLRNELKHMLFYLHSASMIRGLHREEVRKFLLEEATSEMEHVKLFQDLIIGLGGIPTTTPNSFQTFSDVRDILTYALTMEDEVVKNYTERSTQAEEWGGIDGKWIESFLEEQIADSRTDADHIRQMLR
jgi:bacterioferritin (cytochrome b1)